MPDCGGVRTAQGDRFLHRGSHPRMAVLLDQAQHLDHLARAALLSMTTDQLVEESIVTGRPPSSLPPRRERFGSGQRARLALEHIQIMFQLRHLLMAFVTALVARDAAALVANLHPA